MKDKANQGFLKEISKKTSTSPKKEFNYSKPVTKQDKINNMAINSRSREYKSAKPDKGSNFKIEQNQAKQSHKGNK